MEKLRRLSIEKLTKTRRFSASNVVELDNFGEVLIAQCTFVRQDDIGKDVD